MLALLGMKRSGEILDNLEDCDVDRLWDTRDIPNRRRAWDVDGERRGRARGGASLSETKGSRSASSLPSWLVGKGEGEMGVDGACRGLVSADERVVVIGVSGRDAISG